MGAFINYVSIVRRGGGNRFMTISDLEKGGMQIIISYYKND